MLDRLSSYAERSISFFFAVERNRSGAHHLHALVSGTQSLTAKRIAHAWRLGDSRVTVYDPTKGGAWYVSKTVGDAAAEFDLSPRMPPRIGVQASRPTACKVNMCTPSSAPADSPQKLALHAAKRPRRGLQQPR